MTRTDVRTPAGPRHAAVYIRRSSVSSDSPGDASREAQTEAGARLAAAFAPDMPVVEYVDWGISGRRDDRPEYMQLKAAIESGKVCCVFSYSLSRLGRTARELDALFSLCEANAVQVITQADGTLTASSATGKFLRRILGELAELESELAKERSGSARAARLARHEAAGVEMPGSLATYGMRHIKGHDGVYRSEPDPERPIEPVLQAYRDAGSVRAACELLQQRGIPAPKGGKVWGASTLSRILAKHDAGAGLMPKPNAAGHRRPTKTRTAFAGVIRCWCGRTMTSSPTRSALYCAGGRDSGASLHGRYFLREADLRTMLQPAVDDYMPNVEMPDEDVLAAELGKLEARRAGLNALAEAGEIEPDQYRAKLKQIKAEIADVEERGRPRGLIHTVADLDLSLPPDEVNRTLRQLWRRVDLNQGYTTATVSWAGPWHGALEDQELTDAIQAVSDDLRRVEAGFDAQVPA